MAVRPTIDSAAGGPVRVADSGSVRLTVVRWDDTCLTGRTHEGNEEVQVPLNGEGSQDWRYLTKMLEQGMQLNVVGTGEERLLVLEPDYLVDISAIAACFESWAESPMVALLNKIRPSQQSEALVLGNLASQFLDEEVHAAAQSEEEPRYADSVNTFFRHHAINLLTAGVGEQFHRQGRLQQQNIRRAVREMLPALVGGFDAREVMLEPSFFSERLGLQGRMDFLQLDHRVVIEQKSGRGGFPQPDPDTPVAALKHRVQLLLYMALLKEQDEMNGKQGVTAERQALLLYSKYKNSLVPLAETPALLQRAMRVRNGIAAAERHYARGGLEVLTRLTPEQLNERGQRGVLWEQYVRPQITELLRPLHECSELERAYYLRFQTFLAAEHMRAKVGSGVPEDAGFAAKWKLTLAEKLLAGDIFADLTLMEPQAGSEGRVDTVVLRFCDNADHDIANFRVGDTVILYPYDEESEPDCCRTMVFRATIAEMNSDSTRLALRAAQTDAHVFLRSADKRWAIEHDFLESSFAPLYRGMHTLLSAPQERRDLLLLQRRPNVDAERDLRLDHGDFNSLALKVKQAQDLFLIIGPPGTGKTSFGLMTTLREELAEAGSSVLLASYTNRAVDEVCSKLAAEGIEFIRIGSRLACAEAYRERLLDEQVQQCRSLEQLKSIIMNARVVVGTTSALGVHAALLGLRSFTLAIIDEASQILEPHLMSLLAAQVEGHAAIRKFVMIGDHKQLPAVVQQTEEESQVDNPALQAIGLCNCRLSLFERLLWRYSKDEQVTYLLTRQGRMHPAIARFPNEAFYRGVLREVPLPHQLVKQAEGDWPRVEFVDVQPAAANAVAEKVNVAEAAVIAERVVALWQQLGPRFTAESAGVIVPYRNQIAAVRAAIEERAGGLPPITIDTVERFQGSQRDTIIYGLTVQTQAQLEFLTELNFEEDGLMIDRKLNVAITRARERLLIVGNATLLRTNKVYERLIEEITNDK